MISHLLDMLHYFYPLKFSQFSCIFSPSPTALIKPLHLQMMKHCASIRDLCCVSTRFRASSVAEKHEQHLEIQPTSLMILMRASHNPRLNTFLSSLLHLKICEPVKKVTQIQYSQNINFNNVVNIIYNIP